MRNNTEQLLLQKLDNYIQKHYIDKLEVVFYSKKETKEPSHSRRISKPKNKDYIVCSNEAFIKDIKLDESFSESLLRIIDSKHLKDSDVYKKAHLDRKLFSKIRSNKYYSPSKQTAIALCIALELDLKQSKDLLKKAGFALSNSNMFDVIIKFFITQKKYDLYLINDALLQYDQKTII